MNLGVLLASALWLFGPAMQSGRPVVTPPPPPSNTFVSAAEVVLDDADKVDVSAPDVRFEAEMRDLKTAKDNLDRMAYSDREHEIVSSANDLIFAISACHVQAKDGANTAKCESQIAGARNRAMDVLGQHKTGATWVKGPPAELSSTGETAERR